MQAASSRVASSAALPIFQSFSGHKSVCPAKKCCKNDSIFSPSSWTECAFDLTHSTAGLPQQKQWRGGNPISLRHICLPSESITSMSKSREYGVDSSTETAIFFSLQTSALIASKASGPVIGYRILSSAIFSPCSAHFAETSFTAFCSNSAEPEKVFISPGIFRVMLNKAVPQVRRISSCLIARCSRAISTSSRVTDLYRTFPFIFSP